MFDTAPAKSGNKDKIIDWSAKHDTIQLENAIFTLLTTTGDLAQSRFAQVSDATLFDNGRTITYVSSTGNLYYDTNGSTDGGATLFATLAPSLALTYLDFAVT